MHPVICTIGPLTVFSYGLMLALAVVVCSFLLKKDFSKNGINPEFAFDLVFWVVLAGVLGARIFYIILNLGYFSDNVSEVIMIQNGGLSWQGGLIGGALTAIWIIKRKSLPLIKMMDLIAPYLALGQSIGRIGCFLNGCCYGKHVSWGLYFPVHDAHLHPTQLYSSFGLLMIYFGAKYVQKIKTYNGQAFVFYLASVAVWRFIVEFFRGDHFTTVFGLSVFQYMCVLFLTIALILHAKLRSKTSI